MLILLYGKITLKIANHYIVLGPLFAKRYFKG